MFRIGNLFSWQHFLVLGIVVGYTVLLLLLLRKRSKRTQFIVFLTLAIAGVALFSMRWWNAIFQSEPLSPGQWGGLLPLELCNIGTFVLPFTIIFKKRFLFVFSFYINFIGALMAFVFVPDSILVRDFYHPQFLDFFFLHANLIAIPILMEVLGWYKLRFKDALLAVTLFLVLGIILLGINILLDVASWPGDHTNYMFIMGSRGFPIIDQLWGWIPVPLVYLLPILPIFFGFCILLTLPFVKRGERKEQFRELGSSFKTLGF
ncbi:MAG: YwaF family protein [Firmicutes bacterium]|nr:YwaF family protein [Bacillota bacterium]